MFEAAVIVQTKADYTHSQASKTVSTVKDHAAGLVIKYKFI